MSHLCRQAQFESAQYARPSGSVSGVDRVSVSVMEGDSVTLHTGVQTNQQEDIKWYCNNTRIAQITGDLTVTCTDVQCEDGDERFRDRLKLDHQTGSLTITNTDAGEYKLKIFSRSRKSFEKTFCVTGHGVSAAERDEVKRKSMMEGESVTLDTGVISPSDVMTWYFNDTRIAEITGDQSKICTDVQCKERFRDRLKLDHQTGSLTITNTRNTHSGEYVLDISGSSFNIKRIFNVSVTDSGLSSAVVAGICAAAVLLVAAGAGVIYWKCKERRKDTKTQHDDQANGVKGLSLNQTEILMGDASHMSSNQTDALGMNTNNLSQNQIEIEREAAIEILM
ncbi:unnamed protein product [Leuciscus chuanchicus]